MNALDFHRALVIEREGKGPFSRCVWFGAAEDIPEGWRKLPYHEAQKFKLELREAELKRSAVFEL